MNRVLLRWVGATFWVALAIAAVASTRSTRQGRPRSASLVKYFASRVQPVKAIDPSGQLKVNDPIFARDDSGRWMQIGYVSAKDSSLDHGLELSWYASDIDASRTRLLLHRNSGRLEDVVATLLPPEKRKQIEQRITIAFAEHGEALVREFVPLVEASLRKSLPIIEDEFQLALDRHQEEIAELTDRWNQELVQERLVPLARNEILPIIREHGEPTAQQIGRDLWDRASLWSFGWRALYDRSPLPQRDLLQEEWDRFVDEEAVPVIESHMDDVVAAAQSIVSDIASNSVIREEVADVLGDVLSDPAVQNVVREILLETLINNERLQEAWRAVWSSPEARQALDMAGDRLEPVVRQIGDDVFGSRDDGINPDFARVLRNQILGKDRRWLTAERSTEPMSSPLMIVRATGKRMTYPLVYVADDGQPDDPPPSASRAPAASRTSDDAENSTSDDAGSGTSDAVESGTPDDAELDTDDAGGPTP